MLRQNFKHLITYKKVFKIQINTMYLLASWTLQQVKYTLEPRGKSACISACCFSAIYIKIIQNPGEEHCKILYCTQASLNISISGCNLNILYVLSMVLLSAK